jgi:hypothetical protein
MPHTRLVTRSTVVSCTMRDPLWGTKQLKSHLFQMKTANPAESGSFCSTAPIATLASLIRCLTPDCHATITALAAVDCASLNRHDLGGAAVTMPHAAPPAAVSAGFRRANSITADLRSQFWGSFGACQANVRSWEKSGRHLLVLSVSQFDPLAEFALLAKSYRLAVATVGAAWLSPISATTTPTT